MKNFAAFLLCAGLALCSPAFAQTMPGGGGGGSAPCSAFGTTAGTCLQGAGAAGTPSSINLTNGTALPIGTGVSGLGTGVATALGVNVGSAGAPVVNGGALGTPSSGTLSAATGLPVSTGVSGLGSGVATALAITHDASGGVCTVGGGGCTGSGNTTITPTSGNTANDAVCMSNTTTTITDCGFAPAQQSSVIPEAGSWLLTSAQWNNQNPFQATATGTETFPAVSTLSLNGAQFLQNASASAVLTIQPNAADAACVTGSSCGSTGASAALSAGYGAFITAAANKLYITPIPYSGGGSGTVNSGTSGQLAYYASSTNAVSGTTPGTGVLTALGVNLSAVGGVTSTIAAGTSSMGTSAISSGACATVVTTSAPNTATTDVISAGFNGDPTGVTGYAPSASGMLTIISYPSSGNVNFKVCNNTSSSVTPGALTLNWRVTR